MEVIAMILSEEAITKVPKLVGHLASQSACGECFWGGEASLAACVGGLGLGQQPPAPSWGSMLNTAKNFMDNAPWMAIWPGLAIFVLVLAFNLLGDGLRDAADPYH